MTITRPTAPGALLLAATLVLAACGGSAATPAPTAAPVTPAPTEAPATPAPTEAPTEAPVTPEPSIEAPSIEAGTPDPGDNGGFAFKPGDVLDYYISVGFECEDPTPSTQAKDYTTVRCFRDAGGGSTELIALVVSADGVTGDAFAALLNEAGSEMPDLQATAEFLGGFTAAMLGEEIGTNQAVPWLLDNLGAESAQTEINGMLFGTYTEDDDGGVGMYVEVANQAFMSAPAP